MRDVNASRGSFQTVREAGGKDPLDEKGPRRHLRQNQHEDQRQMAMLRGDRPVVGRQEVGRQFLLRLVGRRRLGVARLGRPGEEEVGRGLGRRRFLVHDRNPNGLVGTGLHAGRRLAHRQTAAAHVALPHDPHFLAVARHVVGTLQHAILAANALVVEVPDDARDGVLFIGQHRAALHAGRFDAVMAGGRDVLDHRGLAAAAGEQAHLSPDFVLVQAVQIMAGGHAGLASGAGIEIDLEGVLLAFLGGIQGNEVAIIAGLQWNGVFFVRTSEALDGRLLLLPQEHVDERELARLRLGTLSRSWRRSQDTRHGWTAPSPLSSK